MPTFVTSRLIVRPRSRNDLEQCLLMDRDPKVTQYIKGPWSDPEKHRAFILERMHTVYQEGLGYWSVVERFDTRTFLGWVLLLPCHEHRNEVEIGWRFIRENWGHGYATEAAWPVLDHAFQRVKLPCVVADINPSNTASMGVARKLGMAYVEDRTVAGEISKSYRINRSQYIKRR